MSRLRRWLQDQRKFLSEVWHFSPLFLIIGGLMLYIVVLTVIHINGYLTANQFALGITIGVLAMMGLTFGFKGSEQKGKELK